MKDDEEEGDMKCAPSSWSITLESQLLQAGDYKTDRGVIIIQYCCPRAVSQRDRSVE